MTLAIKTTRLRQSRLTKRQIIATIIATSCIWITLNICIFYSSGAYVSMENTPSMERRGIPVDGGELTGEKVGLPLERGRFPYERRSLPVEEEELPVERGKAADDRETRLPNPLRPTERRNSNGKEIKSQKPLETKEALIHVTDEGIYKLNNVTSGKRKNSPRAVQVSSSDGNGLVNALQFSVKTTLVPAESSYKNSSRQDTTLSDRLLSPLLSPSDDVQQDQEEHHDVSVLKGDKILKSNSSGNSIKVKDVDVRTLQFVPDGQGENGRGIATFPWEEAKVKEGWARASFNEFVSDKISLERSIPDNRNKDCTRKLYDYSRLPKTSVIICFTEESWSTLLRSLHSVLNRTPPELLEEVLLVDDFSQTFFQGRSLEEYISKLPKVRLLRLPHRHGLVRARIAGITNTTGEVITFLDSHIECNKGWLEPLLESIRTNRKTIVSPIIDTISDQTFQYVAAPDNIRGGFAWTLEFRWVGIEVPRSDPTENIRTPTIAGGLFSIDRKFFHELGLYDPGLEIWGSENMELSFKAWMCGGRVEIVPCSRVGHVFRKSQPYKFPKGNVETFLRNNIRIAQVWMDDYIDYFYLVFPTLRHVYAGDITDRKHLKETLKCQSFKWFLENIFPELHVPSLTPRSGLGLRNIGHDKCLDRGMGNGPINVLPCSSFGGGQHFQLTQFGLLETVEYCVGRIGVTFIVAVMNCRLPGVLHFRHDRPGETIVAKENNKCLTIVGQKDLSVQLMDCQSNDSSQHWRFAKYSDPGNDGFGRM